MLARSVINQNIDEALKFFKSCSWHLPPWSVWSPKEWQQHKDELAEIKATHLGWDVTDFGQNNFKHIGRTIFTLRNGKMVEGKSSKTYCQKVMWLQVGQRSPIHYHGQKMEDIINIGGGEIEIHCWPKTKQAKLGQGQITLELDGFSREYSAGQVILLKPGESITIKPGTFHEFWATKDEVISMEISSVCDDLTDNKWLIPAVRFPKVEEDMPAKYILCSEYGMLS